MRYRLLVVFLLIMASLAVFRPVFNHGFVNWDDGMFIYENQLLNPPGIDNTIRFWKEPYRGLYLPITGTTWSILAWLSQYAPAEPYGSTQLATGGLNPRLFHTASLIAHLLGVLAVFSILRMLLRYGFRETQTGSGKENTEPSVELAAGIGALVFALHPVQVETVAWASELKDLLCGLFSLLAVREYLAFAFASKENGKTGNKTVHYVAACALFILALLSKPAAVVVPLAAFILDRWAVKRPLKEIAYSLAGWFMAAFVFALVAKSVQQSDAALIAVPLWGRPFIAGDALAFYIYKLALPLELGIDYGRRPDWALQQWWIYVTWLVPAAIAAAIWFSKKRGPYFVSFGIVAVSLLPVLGFTPFLFQEYSTVADHYLYFPMLGVALSVSLTVFNHRTKLLGAVCAAVIILFVIRSSSQVSVWSSETALYTNALAVNPGSVLSHYNLGNSLKRQGKLDAAIHHYKAAVKIHKTAAKIQPLSLEVRNNLGIALRKQEKLDEAAYYLKEALQIDPDFPSALNNMGLVLAKQGKLDEAIFHYEKALKIQPNVSMVHHNLGLAVARQGKFNEAISHYNEAVKLEPGNEDMHNNLGIALNNTGRVDEAIRHFKTAVTIRPDYTIVHYNLGIALKKMGKLDEAAIHFSTALKISPSFHRARRQLESVNAKIGEEDS